MGAVEKKHLTPALPTRAVRGFIISIFIMLTLLWVAGEINRRDSMGGKQLYKNVLLLGIDGMDPNIVSKLMEEGKLPNFKRLSETGSFLLLNTSYPPVSPVAWTTLATGSNPGKHGIFDFITRDPATYLPQLTMLKSVSGITGTRYVSPIKTEPFWRLTSRVGIPTTVVRWPVTFPPEKVDGKMLSGLGVPDIRGFLSGYTFITESEPPAGVKGPHRAVHVERDEDVIRTILYGPKTRERGSSLETPVEIRLAQGEEPLQLIADGLSYPLKEGEWCGWIRITFKACPLKKVQGIFKAYVVSAEPFEMYVTSIQIDPSHPVLDISYPAGFSADLAQEIGQYGTLGMPEETAGYEDSVLPEHALLSQIHQVEDERDRMFWKGFENFQAAESGVYAFVYDSSDRLQHVFWNASVLNGDEGSLHPAIEDYYRQKDTLLGKVLRQIDNKTLLLIVSDHGFTSFERAVNINTWLVKNGFMTLTRELEEGDEGALFQYVDWNRTKAYSVGFASMYVNLAGREKEGIVKDRDAVVEEIIAGLRNLTDEKYGLRVANAYRREDIYSGPYVTDAPDIIIGFQPGYRMDWQSPIGGFSQDIIIDNPKKWGGDHLMDPSFVPGVIFSNAKFTKDSASQVDVTPTVLHALGIKTVGGMDGESLLG